MAVDRDELVAILHETQRALAVLPIDHPGRHDLEMSLWDLRLQRSRLANTKVAASGADLTAAQFAVDRVRRLSQLGPQHVQRLLNAKGATTLSPRTVAYIRSVLRQALRQAERWGMVSRNVASLATPPRISRREIQPLGPDEARIFTEAIRGDRLEPLYLLALGTGLRQGEILGLAWGDVDLAAATVTVRHALQRVGGRLELVPPKSLSSRRVVALPGFVVDALHAQHLRQRRDRLLAGSRWQQDDRALVFTTTVGTPMDGIAVTRRLQAILRTAGLPRQRFHDLRHACASLMLARGVAPRVAMETLGHSQISLTLNTYSHVIPALGRSAAEEMDALLGPRESDTITS